MKIANVFGFLCILTLLISCGKMNMEEQYPEYIGQWQSDTSLLSIRNTGFIDYFTEKAGMSGQATTINDNKIVFWIIIIPKTLRITKPIHIKENLDKS